jgi:hypothetical protein
MKQLFTALILLSAISLQAQPNGKAVLMEKITSAGCPGCAYGGYIMDSVLNTYSNVYSVAIHRADNAHPDSMACADGDSILAEYLWAHPTAMVDRVLWSDFPRVSLTTSQWFSKIDLRLQEPVVATVGGTTTYDSTTRSLSVTVNGFILWNRETDIRVNAYIVEDSVTGIGPGYDQLNGNNNSPGSPTYGLGDPIVGYIHRNVLRDMLGGHHGEAGVVPNPVSAGTPFSHTFTTTLDSDWDTEKMHVLVLVQRHDPDPDKREIYNVNKIPLNGSVLADLDPSLASPLSARFQLRAFPNPSADQIRVQFPENGNWTLSLRGLTGQVLERYRVQGDELFIRKGKLTPGIYFLESTHEDGPPMKLKLVFY